MKNCHQLDNYIDNRLSSDVREQFESHLTNCPACSQSIAVWNRIGREITDIGQELIASTDSSPSPSLSAMRPESRFRSAKTVVKLALAAAVLVGSGVFIFVGKQAPQKDSPPNELPSFTATYFQDTATVRDIQVNVGTPIHITNGMRAVVHLQQDKVGIRTGSTAIIEKAGEQETVVDIKSGTLAFQVHQRTPKYPFVVHAGRYRVKVVGTQFSVALKDGKMLDVVVKEGIVEVTDTARHHSERLLAGRKLVARGGDPPTISMATADDTMEIDVLLSRGSENMPHKDRISKDMASPAALPINLLENQNDNSASPPQHMASADDEPLLDTHRSKRAVKNASVAEWQQWVLEGRVDEARTELQAYLRHTTDNADAWFLLADCQKRKKEYRQTVATYQKAIPHLSQRAGQTARYRAAAILQDNLGAHQEAIRLLEKFLKVGKPSHHLEAEAMLRLGVSLRAVGETDRATNLFRQIVANHGATGAAIRARKFLE